MTYQPNQSEDTTLKPVAPATTDDNDFDLPAACPMRNEGDDICEACQ